MRTWPFLTSIFSAMLLSCSAWSAPSQSLETLAIHPVYGASATALSLNSSVLSAQIQAEVTAIHVGVSQQVKQDQVLVTLECADYELALRLAQARLRAAEARKVLAVSQRDRIEHLFGQQLASRELTDSSIAEATARSAELDEAALSRDRAQLDVSRCSITAPFDGIVVERRIAEGQLAAIASPLLTLVDTNRIELSVRIDPAEIELMQASPQLLFEFGQTLPVKIHHLGGVIDPATRNQEVRFIFPEGKPLPGTAGKLVWQDPRLFLPAEYIVRRGEYFGVFVDREGVAEFVPIDKPVPGRANPVNLPPETLIVTQGLGKLQHGDRL